MCNPLSPQPERIISLEVTDQEAKAACVRFADDHRMLVEVRIIIVMAEVRFQSSNHDVS